MAKLIVGLGNPGKQYAQTRHNVGFWCVLRIMETVRAGVAKEKWRSTVAEATIQGERVYLLQPLTYMNLSGEAVRAAIDFLKLENLQRNLIVVYDDMDLPVGKIRLREKGSAGGHNGMKSIIEHLGTEAFPRIRIGIGRPEFDIVVTDYVLSRFSGPERSIVETAVIRAADAAVAACTVPFATVMNVFNSAG
ncbi:MAG: aminoacyl-tRNA hydrolase [Bacilli bacterium]